MSASLPWGDQQKELLIESGGYGCRGTFSQDLRLTDFQFSELGSLRSHLCPIHQPRPRTRLKAA